MRNSRRVRSSVGGNKFFSTLYSLPPPLLVILVRTEKSWCIDIPFISFRTERKMTFTGLGLWGRGAVGIQLL